MTTITIQTTTTNRIIKQTLQALIKSDCITKAYKIPYVKQYNKNEEGKFTTTNIQIITITPAQNRDKSGINMLNNILKDREYHANIKENTTAK
jgi:hypothetical protein